MPEKYQTPKNVEYKFGYMLEHLEEARQDTISATKQRTLKILVERRSAGKARMSNYKRFRRVPSGKMAKMYSVKQLVHVADAYHRLRSAYDWLLENQSSPLPPDMRKRVEQHIGFYKRLPKNLKRELFVGLESLEDRIGLRKK